MPEPTPAPHGRVPPGRRAVLVGAIGAGGWALVGCGIHLEDDAPHVPLVPRRTPIGAESQLLALLHNTRELAAAARTWRTGPQVGLARALAATHSQQADVLAALLSDAHVPTGLIAAASPSSAATTGASSATATGAATGSATGSATGAATGSSTGSATAAGRSPSTTGGAATSPTTGAAPTPPTTSADIAALEQSSLVDAPALAAAPAPLLATVAAVLAQRYATAAVVGGTTPHLGPAGAPGPQPSAPTTTGGLPSGATTATGSSATSPAAARPGAGQPAAGRWRDPDLVALLAATRSTVYGFEVVAAQGDAPARALGLRTLATLAAIRFEQEAALSTPAPPAAVGYPLPFPVTTPALARSLAARLATRLRAAYGSGLDAAAEGSVPFLDLVRWLGQVEVAVHDWGGPLVPFPGMTTR